MDPDRIRANFERIRAEVGADVTVVAATKYVSVEDMAVLVEAGVEVVGENRAQNLEAKHAVYGDAFRWHFIGRLQSRKAKIVNRICELCHSLETESAALASQLAEADADAAGLRPQADDLAGAQAELEVAASAAMTQVIGAGDSAGLAAEIRPEAARPEAGK